MKAVIFNQYGSANVLEYRDIDTPKIKPDELLVKIAATSVNPVDWKIRRGDLQLISGYNFPKKIGADLSGVVVEVGERVTRFEVGDEVYTFLNPAAGGACAEYAAVPASIAALKPSTMTHQEAAAVPIAGLTALQSFFDLGKIRPGQKVLVNGASGGVGTYAVQIAKAIGTEVTGVCSGANLDRVKRLGADIVIDYTQVNFTQQETKYDIILDAVATQTFANCQKVLQPDGVYISTLPTPETILASAQTWLFPGQTAKLVLAQPNRRDLDALRDWIEAGKVQSVIDRVYPLSDIIEAHNYSETGRTVGKIVCVVES